MDFDKCKRLRKVADKYEAELQAIHGEVVYVCLAISGDNYYLNVYTDDPEIAATLPSQYEELAVKVRGIGVASKD